MSKKDKVIQSNNNILFVVIIILLVIIAILAFFVWRTMGTAPAANTGTASAPASSDLKITVIDDARCTTCQTDELVNQLRETPFLAAAQYETLDFSDPETEQYIVDNNIANLPAIVFSTNQIADNGTMSPYLTALPSGEYSLQVGASFNPFATRSENGFLVIEQEKIDSIKEGSYVKWNPDATISWIEYSDLECPFCAKLHNSGTIEEITEKYGDDINMAFKHFPLDFHANAKPGAELLECAGELWGIDAYYSLVDVSFAEERSTKSFLIEEAGKLGLDTEAMQACLDDGRYSEKVDAHQNEWSTLFGVTWTPGSVLINNTTGEYEVISGAYPTATFETTIDKLLNK